MPIIHEMDGKTIIEEVKCEGCGKDFDSWEDVERCPDCGTYLCENCWDKHYLDACPFLDLYDEDCE